MAFQNLSPTTYTSPVLIGEPVHPTGGSPDSLPTITNSSVAFEIQSTTGAMLPPRMTSTQKNALTGSNGMMVFDTTTSTLWLYAGAWIEIESQGDVFLAGNGTESAPGYAFAARPGNGMWTSGNDFVDFSAAGQRIIKLDGSTAAADNYTVFSAEAAGEYPRIYAEGISNDIAALYQPKGDAFFTFGPNLVGGGTPAATNCGGLAFSNKAGTHAVKYTVPDSNSDVRFQLPIQFLEDAAITSTTLSSLVGKADGTWSFQLPAMQYVVVTLTAAQLRGMNATPVQIIPSPDLGLMVAVHKVQMNKQHVTAAFTGGGDTYLQYAAVSASTNTATTLAGNGFMLAASSTSITVYGASTTDFIQKTAVNGEEITITNDGAAFAGGGTSTLDVHVWFSVIPI